MHYTYMVDRKDGNFKLMGRGKTANKNGAIIKSI